MVTLPIYLVVAYGVFWALPFALMLGMWFRQRKIEQTLHELEKQLKDQAT